MLEKDNVVMDLSQIKDTTNLRDAFYIFNQMSEYLSNSYATLENQVKELSAALENSKAQRLKELAEKEQLADRMESLVQLLPAGVIVIDNTGIIRECNQAAKDILGEPLFEQKWLDIIERCFFPDAQDGHEVALKSGRLVSISTRSLEDNMGQIILLTDQTETRRLQQKVSRNQRLSAMGKMVSALAHQIRTPLSAAMLYAGHLQHPKVDREKTLQCSEKILSRLNHLDMQIKDMLVYVKGKIALSDEVSSDLLLQKIKQAMEASLSTTTSSCSFINDAPDAIVHCHCEYLISAVLNLVDNAIQAADTKASMSITIQGKQNRLLLSVEDQGPGIAHKEMSRISEEFYTTKKHGTGLGLSVVKIIAKAHQGKFTIISEPGQYTRACIELPYFEETCEKINKSFRD